ncbi:outer membrane protein assembly factor BamB family protein, partial [Nocardia altamirensis]|uniref:outer membrane protein assembly factor BamB family protein n=1 Tax=Nocardia altamirensis TaxID=472158 RepID=UPI0008407840
MAWPPGVRGLVFAAVLAVGTSAGAVAVLMHPEDSIRKITGTNSAAPGLAWSIDAATLAGQAAAEFRTPVGGTEYDHGSAGFVAAGNTMITVIGARGESAPRDPQMYGIDARTGKARWHAPATGLGGCADTPVDGKLICFTSVLDKSPALVGYDIDTGAITRTPIDWLIFGLAADQDRLYVAEGDVESDDVRVHAGTLADPKAHWSRAFAVGTSWDSVDSQALDIAHGQGVLGLGAGLAGFDLRTGSPTWTAELNGCSSARGTFDALVVRTRIQCPGSRPEGSNGRTGADILDRTGGTLATTDSAAVHDVAIDRPTDATIPILLADSAYDRRDGTVRWTNPDLVTRDGSTLRVATLGDTALLFDSRAGTTTGVDLRTGHQLWETTTRRFGTVHTWNGRLAVLSDNAGLWAIDPHTGDTIWDIPFRAVNDAPTPIADGQLTEKSSGTYVFTDTHTMIGLRPL